MKPVIYSLTKTDFSNDRAPPVVCWSRYLRTLDEAKEVAERNNGVAIYWVGAGDGLVGNVGWNSYYIEKIEPMSMSEALDSLPLEPKRPRKKRAAK